MKIRLAAVCLALGIGLVVFSYKHRQESGETAEVGRAPVTKPYPRERDERELRTKNPREEFEVARKRGLTDEEVRGIVGEYRKVVTVDRSFGRSEEEIFHDLAERELDWYLEALGDGFGLTMEQKMAAQTKLPTLVDMVAMRWGLLAEVDRQWELSVPEADGKLPSDGSVPGDREVTERMGGMSLSSSVSALVPWKLCDLDERQKEMVGFFDEQGQWNWLEGGERTLDFGTTDCYADLSDPFSEAGVMAVAGNIFPLSMRQVERLGDYEGEAVSPHTPKLFDGGYLEQVKFLTAPQLKTLLLYSPEIALKLMKELAE